MYWRLIPLYLHRIRRGTGSVLRVIGEWFGEIGKVLRGIGRVLLAIGRVLLGIVGAVVGALGASVLLALLVGIGLGADELGATAALALFPPAWAGFFVLFFLWFVWHRELKRLLEGVLLILALEAFAFPLASLGFVADHFDRTIALVGDQTIVWSHVVGVMLGDLGVVGVGTLIALFMGGPLFLLFLLLRLELLYAGRTGNPAGRRRVAGTVKPILLVGAIAGLLSVGLAPAQITQTPVPSSTLPPGVQPPGPTEDMMPMMQLIIRANLFFKHTEIGGLDALGRIDRFKSSLLAGLGLNTASLDRFKKALVAGIVLTTPITDPLQKALLARFGLGTSGTDFWLQGARQRLESYLLSTGNLNLQVGKLRDLGQEVEGEIVTHSQELVERLRIDKRTGALRVVR